MIRIAGVNIPENKNIDIALTHIYGIGHSRAQEILNSVQIDHKRDASGLTKEEINTLKEYIDKNYQIEGDLRREISYNIQRLKEIGSYRGTRHSKGLPMTGRTKSNSQTRRRKKGSARVAEK
ncbi:MAG: 30S ribosomal protein S13 [Parcubacteria group bacterium SW_4_49_11]|jgi:small subunit ribosomal protein S13|nr:MAG: 30S ribosomal protein S13 [Parcubacteria group bacterium SW_4_49_11]